VSVLVLDATIALQWVLASPGTEQALDLLSSRHRFAVPDVLKHEIEGVLEDAERLGLTPDPTAAGLAGRFRNLGIEVVDSRPHLGTAVELSMALSQPILACVYLSVAMARGTRLVTSDKEFVSSARRHPRCRDNVALLGEPLSAVRRVKVASGP
jgi:predicted nucleic acid-binding protein